MTTWPVNTRGPALSAAFSARVQVPRAPGQVACLPSAEDCLLPCGVHLIIAWAFQDPRYGLAVHSFLRRDAGLAARPRPAAPSSFQDHPGPVAFCNCKGLCLAPLRSRKARPLRTVCLSPGAQLRAGPASGGGWETCVFTHQGVDLLASTDRPRDFPAGGRAPHGKRAPSAPFDEMLDAGHPWEDAGHRLHPGRQQLLWRQEVWWEDHPECVQWQVCDPRGTASWLLWWRQQLIWCVSVGSWWAARWWCSPGSTASRAAARSRVPWPPTASARMSSGWSSEMVPTTSKTLRAKQWMGARAPRSLAAVTPLCTTS